MPNNIVSITGNLTRDAELRATKNESFILSFSIAVNERRKQEDGTWKDEPSYFDCKLFGKRAQGAAPYLVKGTKVTVQGKLRQERWQTKDGQNRSAVLIAVDEFEFMSKMADKPQTGFAVNAPASRHDDVYDEELPF